MNEKANKSMQHREPLVLVSGCDDAYAMPLAITLLSAIDHLRPGQTVKVYILDGGITSQSKDRLRRTCRDERVSIEFITTDMSILNGLPVSEHVNANTYLRILIPRILPDSVNRVIYLDSDLLVCRDLTELWNLPQNGRAVLAVQDSAAPYIDSSVGIPSYQRCQSQIVAARPIANFRELGLSPSAQYFNGGLLVVDVDHWRRESISDQLLDCLQRYREHVLWWDQYALNVVLHGRWGALDHRWNQGSHFHTYPSQATSPFDEQTYQQLKRDPWVIHFTSPSKPWHYFCHHPATEAYRRCLQRTPWGEWTPERPQQYLRHLWGHHYKPARERWKKNIRQLKMNLGLKRAA
jgi:lipopolysaccharide biosynthesis glycosyltransferase